MARTLTADFAEAVMAPQTGFLVLELLTITHDKLATPLRIVNNIEDVSSSGNLYTACGFELKPPEEKAEGQPKASISIDNTDQWLTEQIRSLRGGMDVTIELVSASNLAASPPEFDTVEQSGMALRLTEVSYNSAVVRGSLTFDTLSGAQFPSGAFTPTDFRGMF